MKLGIVFFGVIIALAGLTALVMPTVWESLLGGTNYMNANLVFWIGIVLGALIIIWGFKARRRYR